MPDDSSTSPTLLGRVAQYPPDQAAWTEFVDRYGTRIVRWCRAWGLQDADARDTSQEILLRLAVRLRSFQYDATGSFRGFLRKFVNDTLMDVGADQTGSSWRAKWC